MASSRRGAEAGPAGLETADGAATISRRHGGGDGRGFGAQFSFAGWADAERSPAPAPASSPAPDSGNLDEMERHAILQALRKHHFNRTETAKNLGISRRALLYKLQRLRAAGWQVE